jgi:hypothetical protein
MSKADLRLDWCSHAAAKYAVEHWHYSKTFPRNKTIKVGAWENGRYIGVVVFGTGASDTLGKRFSLTPFQTCELVRIALTIHETQVTRIVSVAMKFLRIHCPDIRLVVSFADPEHGHHGGIYQGGGWVYAGMTEPSDEYIINGKRMHGRAIRKTMERYSIPGKNTLERIRAWRDPKAYSIDGSSKHRYLMTLDAEMRKRILPLAKPYPKRAGSDTKDTPCHRQGEGGSTPTPALHSSGGDNA